MMYIVLLIANILVYDRPLFMNKFDCRNVVLFLNCDQRECECVKLMCKMKLECVFHTEPKSPKTLPQIMYNCKSTTLN